LANGFLGFDLTSNKAVIWDDGNTRFSSTTEADLGKAVVASLDHPAETANKFVYVSSVATTQNEILEALEKATSAKWDVTRVTTQEQLDTARELLGKGDASGAFTIVKGTCWGNLPGLRQHYEIDEKERFADDVLGIGGVSVQETVDGVLVSAGYGGAHS
jgi:hypothetical protein